MSLYSSEHELFRKSARAFIEAEIAPHHREWEKGEGVPRGLWRKAGEAGLLLPTASPDFGGGGGDFIFCAVLVEELARVNATGPTFSLHSDIVAPYLEAYASDEAKRHWLPKMARGEAIGAIAMTEPGGGSDLAAMRTSARREGDYYVLNGAKTFITNATSCDFAVVAVKTAPELGRKGVSLLLTPADLPGFSKGRQLDKVGLVGQDTGELFFDNVRVPVANLIGVEGRGFYYLVEQLPRERLIVAVRALASIEAMIERTRSYVRERMVFGKPLIELQNTKFKLAEAVAYVAVLRAFVERCIEAQLAGTLTAKEASIAKLVATETQGRFLDEMVQLHGGYGYMSEYVVGRAWLDARVARIYAGTSEIMKDIISRDL